MNPDLIERRIFVLGERYECLEGSWHCHRRVQLIYASEGVLTVQTDQGMWVVPPQRAIWILPNIMHKVDSKRPFWLRTLYAESNLLMLPSECGVVSVDPLARELLIAASVFGAQYPGGGAEERLISVLLDRLPYRMMRPLKLTMPTHQRLIQLVHKLKKDPSNSDSLQTLASQVALTERTAARLFVRDLGVPFGKWRQQLRLLVALERLARGESVTQVAFEVGYSDVSSFINVFKKAFGETPGQYFRS